MDRMLGYGSGMAGFPLRLLARENYDKLVARLGVSQVALITGEEKIIPANARYFCCTVEAMPLERSVDCLVVDEIQLCADRERGHIFTDRLLHAGAVMKHCCWVRTPCGLCWKPCCQRQSSSAGIVSRASLMRARRKPHACNAALPLLPFLPLRCIGWLNWSAARGAGAAVVMGALSPRTRNAQVELYQNGDVDFLIATDAIGMGLNMDIGHVALADDMKFDGQSMRRLAPSELAQIAGRAGRHTTDGTFGVTEDCRPLEQEVIDAIESIISRLSASCTGAHAI